MLNNLSLEQLKKQMGTSYLIDTRHPEIFARSYIESSVNIPVEGAFHKWADQVVPKNAEIVLIVDREDVVSDVERQLKYIGVDNIKGFVIFDPNLDLEKVSFGLCNVRDLSEMEGVYIVDVRTPAEWRDGHIESAHHMELSEFEKRVGEIPVGNQVAITCGAGFRSSVAASILKKHGHKNVESIQGGMRAWNSANLPIVS